MFQQSPHPQVAEHVEAAAEELEGIKGLLRSHARGNATQPDHAETVILTARETRGIARIMENCIDRLDQLRNL